MVVDRGSGVRREASPAPPSELPRSITYAEAELQGGSASAVIGQLSSMPQWFPHQCIDFLICIQTDEKNKSYLSQSKMIPN
jgi:hypothetical protein